jgi:hypothetical protein
MKTEWIFPWSAYDFHFKKEHKFVGSFAPQADAPRELLGVESQIRIVPDARQPSDREAEQMGQMFVTLPLRPEKAEGLAYTVARQVAEQVGFRNGDFRVSYAFVACQRIAENPEEEAEIGGKPYSIRFHLQEVVASPEFDGSAFRAGAHIVNVDLLAQYNETRRDESPIRKFLGYFRIIESLSHAAEGGKPLKATLRAFALLERHFKAIQPGDGYGAFVDAIVEVRHKCAHLRLDKGFGYTPVDPSVKAEVLPHLALLEELTFRCLDDPGVVPG